MIFRSSKNIALLALLLLFAGPSLAQYSGPVLVAPPASGAGSGDVVGPASATNSGIVLFDGTTGKLLKDSTATLPLSDANVANALTISGGTIDNSVIGATTPASGTFSSLLLKNGSNTILNALNTNPDSFSGDLVQIQLSSNGGSTFTGSADAYRLLRGDITLTTGTQSGVFTAAHFQAQTSGSSISTGSAGSGVRALIASAIHNSTGTAESLVGLNSNCAAGESGSSAALGAVNFCYGNRVTTGYVSGFTGTGAINTNYGLWVGAPQNISVGRTIGTQASLFIDDATGTGITTGYSIYTGTGRVRFGGNLEFSNPTAADTTLYGIGRNADTPNALEYFVPTSRIHKWTIAGGTEMTLSATAVNFQDNSITTTGGGSLTGTWSNLGSVTTIDINGGTLDGTVIGGATPAAASVTTLGMANLITWTGGGAITAGNYQCGRNSDATNEIQCNVPTGAQFELSVNDVAEFLFSATNLNANNNTISNIGGGGTDFATGGALIVGPDASAGGSPALNVSQGTHTAITQNQPAINVGAFTNTLSSGTTLGSASAVDISAPTYNGVAGGAAETITDGATVRIAGPLIQGTNITVSNALSFLVDAGDARFDGFVQYGTQTVSVADDGAGTPALATITPTTNNIQVTCNDVHNCNITMGESAQRNGVAVRIVNMGTNSIVFADTGGVSELAGGFTAGQYDSITMTYESDRWVENGRSNN